MHRVTIKPENGRVGLKAHSRASSAVENSHNLPLVYTWFNPDACGAYACATMMKEGMKREGRFFFFFNTRNVGAARIPDFVRGYLFNWPRCASSNNTCYALKLERVYFRARSRPPFLAVWRSTIGRFVFPAPRNARHAFWLLKRRSGNGMPDHMFVECFRYLGKKLLGKKYRENDLSTRILKIVDLETLGSTVFFIHVFQILILFIFIIEIFSL